jgi:hypothetical protein
VTPVRAGLLVFFFSVAAYANSLGNGFAYDDEKIVRENQVVTAGDWAEALGRPWWPYSSEGTGLYRPLTSGALAAQWALFDGASFGFHVNNVLLHSAVSLLVLLFLLELGSVPGAFAGAALFAIHPLHTEVVANVVGQAELLAAFFYLAACILYLRGRGWTGLPRVLRLLGLGVLYFLSLASKEIGVTLPGALLLLELVRPESEGGKGISFRFRVWNESPTFLLLGAALVSYLGLRFLVLGTLGGEVVAPVFQVVGPTARVLTAIALWPQYVRLHLFPLDLSSDYDPGVLFPSEGVDLGVILGILVLASLAVATVRGLRTAPLAALGVLWFLVVILPVSNLLFPTGVLLAERTLYLPSVGLSLLAAGLAGPALSLRPPLKRMVSAGVLLWFVALCVKTVQRNPAWESSFAVAQTLAEEHPESWRSFRTRAQGLEQVPDLAGAAREWDQAVQLAPMNYTLLAQAGEFHGRVGDGSRGDGYLRQAIGLEPGLANAYQILAGNLLRRGLGKEAHGIARAGLAAAGTDQKLWAVVSESYVLKGDLPAAVRAREAAIGADPSSAAEWDRLSEILTAMGNEDWAEVSRAKAAGLRGLSEEDFKQERGGRTR